MLEFQVSGQLVQLLLGLWSDSVWRGKPVFLMALMKEKERKTPRYSSSQTLHKSISCDLTFFYWIPPLTGSFSLLEVPSWGWPFNTRAFAGSPDASHNRLYPNCCLLRMSSSPLCLRGVSLALLHTISGFCCLTLCEGELGTAHAGPVCSSCHIGHAARAPSC